MKFILLFTLSLSLFASDYILFRYGDIKEPENLRRRIYVSKNDITIEFTTSFLIFSTHDEDRDYLVNFENKKSCALKKRKSTTKVKVGEAQKLELGTFKSCDKVKTPEGTSACYINAINELKDYIQVDKWHKFYKRYDILRADKFYKKDYYPLIFQFDKSGIVLTDVKKISSDENPVVISKKDLSQVCKSPESYKVAMEKLK